MAPDRYLEVVYSENAGVQLQNLIDGDIRYEDEPEAYEWLICRDPEGLGTPVTIAGQAVYVFITARRPRGPIPLGISYLIERHNHWIQIIDVRPIS